MKISALELMPVIEVALKRGQRVRMTVAGGSMRPFMRGGDIVELERVDSPPLVGDVLLVRSGSAPERYVLHRVVRVEGGGFFIRGDAQTVSEGPFALEDVLGRVIRRHAKGRVHRFDSGFWHYLGRAWLLWFPLSSWSLRIALHPTMKRGLSG